MTRTYKKKSKSWLRGWDKGHGNTRHGLAKTRFWSTYQNMRNRCIRKNIPAYKKYGAKGIKCEWQSFEQFRNDMYESYLEHVEDFGEKDTQIERIDVYGNYCKENCRWATTREQSLNKRNSRVVVLDGKQMTVFEAAGKLGQNYHAVYARVAHGRKLDSPYRKRERLILFRGVEKTFREWEKELGLSRQLMYGRIFYKGWSVDKALSTPLDTRFSVGRAKLDDWVEANAEKVRAEL